MNNITKHIEKITKPYRQIDKIINPIEKFQLQLPSHAFETQKKIESISKLNKQFGEYSTHLKESFEQISKLLATIQKINNPLVQHLDAFKEIGEKLKEFIEKTPEYYLLIAQYGWFIDLESDLNLALRVAYKLQKNEIEVANELMISYYKENLSNIFKRLIERHPNRKEILSQIQNGYKNKYHSIIIPTILTQIDGICFDFTKRKFFIKERKNKFLPQVTSEIEKLADSFLNLYLSPIQNQTPIMVREKDISNFPCYLNRHEILHGINTDYGTEINSLRVISLLKYLSDILTELENQKNNTK